MKIEPQIRQFTLKELQDLALVQILANAGVADPVAFLKEHDVEQMATYKSSVLAIAITGVKPKPVAALQTSEEA